MMTGGFNMHIGFDISQTGSGKAGWMIRNLDIKWTQNAF